MNDNDLKNLDNEELAELLATLKGMDDALLEQEKILKEGHEENEN